MNGRSGPADQRGKPGEFRLAHSQRRGESVERLRQDLLDDGLDRLRPDDDDRQSRGVDSPDGSVVAQSRLVVRLLSVSVRKKKKNSFRSSRRLRSLSEGQRRDGRSLSRRPTDRPLDGRDRREETVFPLGIPSGSNATERKIRANSTSSIQRNPTETTRRRNPMERTLRFHARQPKYSLRQRPSLVLHGLRHEEKVPGARRRADQPRLPHGHRRPRRFAVLGTEPLRRRHSAQVNETRDVDLS